MPTPLVQLRIGFFLTDQSEPDMGNMWVMVPGSHNASVPLPPGTPFEALPIREVVCGTPGTALMFHQGVYHCGTRNAKDYPRFIQHMVFAPPWLVPSDRKGNDHGFPGTDDASAPRSAGRVEAPEEPFGMGYSRPPFAD